MLPYGEPVRTRFLSDCTRCPEVNFLIQLRSVSACLRESVLRLTMKRLGVAPSLPAWCPRRRVAACSACWRLSVAALNDPEEK